ncbi:MAG: hypothetical protein GY772_24710 [bacterium]|nr:hypothetical protein [bacterium]
MRPWGVFIALSLIGLGFGLGFLAASPPPSLPPPRAAALGALPAPGTPAAAVYEALLNPDAFVRTAALGAVLAELGPDDLESVRTVYESVVSAPTDPELAMLAQWWARHDPESAFEWARTNQSVETEYLVVVVLRTWAQQDPNAASNVLGKLAATPIFNPAMVAILLGWEEGGHADLPTFLSRMPQGMPLQTGIEALARRKTLRHGAADAISWAKSVPDDMKPGGVKITTMRRVASAIAEFDPEAAIAFATEYGDKPQGTGMYTRVARVVARGDGVRAMEWLATLPDGSPRTAAVSAAYRKWLDVDREAAMRWMRSQQTEPWLDPAVQLFAKRLALEDPELALEWAAEIDDGRRRHDAILRAARLWWLADPIAAQNWIDGADLPDGMQKRITKPD